MSAPIDYFNSHTRPQLWNKNEPEYKAWFRFQLGILDMAISSNLPENFFRRFVYRLGIGYFGVGKQSGLPSGICTEDSNIPGVNTTPDHLFGATEVGKYVHEQFLKYNCDIDYMVNTWLYENLFLWMTVKVSKEEHKVENIARDAHSLEQKICLEHYTNVSEFIYS
jgi:hypothetical protein